MIKDLKQLCVVVLYTNVVEAADLSGALQGLLPCQFAVVSVILRIRLPCLVNSVVLRLFECFRHTLNLGLLVIGKALETPAVGSIIAPNVENGR